MKRALRNNGLSLALFAAFAITVTAMGMTGWANSNRTSAEHGGATDPLSAHLVGGEFVSAVFENWEREFLKMAVYVVLTAYLIQKGSAESKKLDEIETDEEQGAAQKSQSTRTLLRSHLRRFLFFRLPRVFRTSQGRNRDSDKSPNASDRLQADI